MEIFICILLFIFGSIIGSFLGCMGYRIPNKIKTTYPNSYCENCKKELKWYMNIPIISYILLKGKCAYCHKKINSIYFLTELLSAILFVINYLVFGFTLSFYISTILTCVLIVTIVSDFLYYYISDRVIIISTILLIILQSVFLKSDAFKYILSAALMFGFMCIIKLIGNMVFKKESLGDGDIKLMAVISLAIGMYNSFFALFIASITGLLFSLFYIRKNKDGIIPFGPFLIIGALSILYINNFINIMQLFNEIW